MDPFDDETGVTHSDGLAVAVHLACVATLVALALTERFADLPGAAAALVSSWYLFRR